MIGIYMIINKVNGKVYIGKTGVSILQRKQAHVSALERGSHHNPYLQSAFDKYGRESFSFRILWKAPTRVSDRELDQREMAYIRKYSSHLPEKGYNLTAGGEGTRKPLPPDDVQADIIEYYNRDTLMSNKAIANAIKKRYKLRWIEIDSRDVARVARAHFSPRTRYLRRYARRTKYRYSKVKNKKYSTTKDQKKKEYERALKEWKECVD